MLVLFRCYFFTDPRYRKADVVALRRLLERPALTPLSLDAECDARIFTLADAR